MQLRDMSADQILEVFEKRQDAYADAYEVEGDEKSRHEALSTGLYEAFRKDDKLSIEDAKRYLWTIETFRDSDKWHRQAQADALRARMGMERAKIALDLWRTEAANLRKI